MAPATGIRFRPHTRVARSATLGRENVCMGNYAEAAGLKTSGVSLEHDLHSSVYTIR
jgi:hypothetical protein